MTRTTELPIGPMQRVLMQEFSSIPPTIQTPAERVEHIFKSIRSKKKELIELGEDADAYAINAVDDMQFIAAGAIAFATNHSPFDRLTLVKRSIPRLVFPAKLSEEQWVDIRPDLATKATRPRQRRQLDPEHLLLLTDTDSQLDVISYSSGMLLEMDSRIDITGQSGCPARGIVIERSFERFIDAVHGPDSSK